MGRLESLRSTFGVPNLYLSVLLLAIYHFLKPHLEFLIDIAQTQGTHPPTSSGSLLCATAAPPVSVRGVNEVHTEQLEDGEDGVRSLRRQAIAMLAKSNSLLPIARLPPELLSRIFIECAYQEWSEHQTDRSRFVLSYVSSHWRTVALSTAALWSNVAVHDYRHARKAHELLERAGNSARSLFILFGLSASTKNLQNLSLANRLLEELHRARSLEIYMTRFECGGLIWPASPSSSLRHLRLEGPGYNAFRWLGVRDEDGRFPEIACTLETRFPHLLSLAAVGYSFCFATWQLPPSLTHLHIDNEHCMHVVDLHAVRDLLQSLPALEGLVLLHAVPDLGQLEVDFISSSSPIALDSLKDLRIAGPISVSLSLMGIIRIPSTARRHISLDMQCVSGALDDWFDVFLTQVRKMDDSFQSVAFADDNPQGNFQFVVTAWRDVHPVDLMGAKQCDSNPPADLKYVLIPQYGQRFVSYVRGITSALPAAQIRSLLLQDFNFSFIDAPEVFARMTQVQALGLGGCAGLSDLPQKVLACLHPFGSSPFQTVRRLHMSEANFEAVFPHLQTICRERQERGMEYRVRLTKCYGVAQHQIDELRQLVPVAWDAQDLCVPKSQYDREDEAVNADLYAEQLIKAVTEAERGQMDV